MKPLNGTHPDPGWAHSSDLVDLLWSCGLIRNSVLPYGPYC